MGTFAPEVLLAAMAVFGGTSSLAGQPGQVVRPPASTVSDVATHLVIRSGPDPQATERIKKVIQEGGFKTGGFGAEPRPGRPGFGGLTVNRNGGITSGFGMTVGANPMSFGRSQFGSRSGR
jgi:hypothetical protein